MASIGSLVADLGLDTVRFENGIKKSQASIKRFSRNAERSFQKMNRSAGVFAGRLAAIATIGFGAMIKGAIDTADQMEKMNRKLGISTEALSQLKFAGEQSGIEFSVMAKSMEKMTNAVGEANQGMVIYQRAFRDLGLSAVNLAKMNPEDQLLAMADAFGTVSNQTDRTALAMDIFGQRGTAMLQLFEGGSDELRNLMQEADGLGLTLNNKTAKGAAAANDAINRAKSAMQGAALQASVSLIPAIEALGNGFSAYLPDAINTGIKGFYKFRSEGLKILSFVVSKFGEGYLKLADIASSLGFDNESARLFENAKFLGKFNQQLLASADAASVAERSVGELSHSVGEMQANGPAEPSAQWSEMAAGIDAAKERAEQLGKTLNVDVFDKTKGAMDQLKDQFRSTIQDMINILVSSGIRKMLAGMFNMGSSGGVLAGLGGLFGFANGGSFEVGGGGGTDSNLVAFKATRGETVTVNKAGESGGGGGGVVFQNSYDFSGSTLSESEVRQMIEQSQSITKRQIQNAMIRGRF